MSSEAKAKQQHMADLIEGFKDFVLDSMAENMHEEFDDHFDFLQMSFDTWIDIEAEGSK